MSHLSLSEVEVEMKGSMTNILDRKRKKKVAGYAKMMQVYLLKLKSVKKNTGDTIFFENYK